LQTLPQKGILVTPLSLDDFLNISDFRILAETHAAGLVAESISTTGVAELRKLFDHAGELIENYELEQYLQTDLEFHRSLARHTGNRYLIDTLSQLHNLSARFWFISFKRAGRLKETLREHLDIIDALEKHDKTAAQKAMRHHLAQSQLKITSVGWNIQGGTT
ncbi:MAG: GntR family transcriptional regulator, partial [Synergistota bacterium]|nr:GntR family transcriptional regulator [Synergistota bacterium]